MTKNRPLICYFGIIILFSVDGGWDESEPWSDCSVSCGGGTQTKMKYCKNPEPVNGGRVCPGDPLMEGPCNETPCPSLPRTICVLIYDLILLYNRLSSSWWIYRVDVMD